MRTALRKRSFFCAGSVMTCASWSRSHSNTPVKVPLSVPWPVRKKSWTVVSGSCLSVSRSKVLGNCTRPPRRKKGAYPPSQVTGGLFRSREAFLRLDDLARHNNQTAQHNNKEPDIHHQTFLLVAEREQGRYELCCLMRDTSAMYSCQKPIIRDNTQALHGSCRLC